MEDCKQDCIVKELTLTDCISRLENQYALSKNLIESIFDRLCKIKEIKDNSSIKNVPPVKCNTEDVKTLSIIERLDLLHNKCFTNSDKLDNILREIESLI